MEYKSSFTKEEIDELEQWFATHEFEQEIDLGSGIHISHVDETLKPTLHIAHAKHDNRAFSGQIHILFKIKEELIKQNKVKGEK